MKYERIHNSMRVQIQFHERVESALILSSRIFDRILRYGMYDYPHAGANEFRVIEVWPTLHITSGTSIIEHSINIPFTVETQLLLPPSDFEPVAGLPNMPSAFTLKLIADLRMEHVPMDYVPDYYRCPLCTSTTQEEHRTPTDPIHKEHCPVLWARAALKAQT